MIISEVRTSCKNRLPPVLLKHNLKKIYKSLFSYHFGEWNICHPAETNVCDIDRLNQIYGNFSVKLSGLVLSNRERFGKVDLNNARFYCSNYSNIRMNWFSLSEPTPRAISNLGEKFVPSNRKKEMKRV